MNKLAYVLISLGFLAASLVAVQSPDNQVNWFQYQSALGLGVAGAVLARLVRKRAVRQASRTRAGTATLRESLTRIVRNMKQLDQEKEHLEPGDVHGRIDRLFRTDLEAFVEDRESIVHLHGLPAYARVMNEFAAGERYLNRVWSASVDGYIEEVHAYLTRARAQFERAQEELGKLG